MKSRWVKLSLFGLGFLMFSIGMFKLLTILEAYWGRALVEVDLYAYLGVLIVTAISSSFFFLPPPSSLFALSATLAVAAKTNPLWVALSASIGTSLGELSGFYFGKYGRRIIAKDPPHFQKVERFARKYGLIAVMLFAFIPSPYLFDITAMAVGASRIPVWRFLSACWIARFFRSLIEVYTGSSILKLLLSYLP